MQVSTALGDVSAELVLAVMRGVTMPIRTMPLLDFNRAALGRLLIALEFYCEAYFSAEGGQILHAECLLLWRTKFADISLDELSEAFRLVAAGQIDKIETDALGRRKVTVTTFGRVLRAYREWRRRVVQAIEEVKDREAAKSRETNKEAQNEAARRAVCERFEQLMTANDSFKSWADVPAFWAKILLESGFFEDVATETKAPIWRRAMDEAVSEAKREMLVGRVKEVRELVETLASGQPSESTALSAKAHRIYGKMLIHALIAPYSNSEKNSENLNTDSDGSNQRNESNPDSVDSSPTRDGFEHDSESGVDVESNTLDGGEH